MNPKEITFIPVNELVDQVKEVYFARSPMGRALEFPTERGSLAEDYLNTSAHESHHALVAKAMGINSSVSLTPEGMSLGRTSFNGNIPMNKFKIIAAAGAVNTVGAGHARGFGHDLYQVSVANYFDSMNPNNVSPYISAAEAILNAHYPGPLRKKVAEILGHLGGTGDIGLVLSQAKFELEFFDKVNLQKLFDDQKVRLEIANKIVISLTENDGQIINSGTISENKDHNLDIQYLSGAKKENEMEKIVCPICASPHHSKEFCSPELRKKERDEFEKVQSLHKPRVIRAFEFRDLDNNKNQTIFSWN